MTTLKLWANNILGRLKMCRLTKLGPFSLLTWTNRQATKLRAYYFFKVFVWTDLLLCDSMWFFTHSWEIAWATKTCIVIFRLFYSNTRFDVNCNSGYFVTFNLYETQQWKNFGRIKMWEEKIELQEARRLRLRLKSLNSQKTSSKQKSFSRNG